MNAESPDGAAKVMDAATVSPQDEGSTLAAKLLAHRPRETSGSGAANRFAYQRTWAFCHLLELHETPGDYVLILEFHDDVLILDDVSNPQVADFYQVKTKNAGSWTRRELVRGLKTTSAATERRVRQKKKSTAQLGLPKLDSEEPVGQSILGKLLEHSRAFNANVRSLNLVSNASFTLELCTHPVSTDRESFCLDCVKPAELAEIEKALNTELQLQNPPWSKVHLRCSPISLKDHETHVAGMLAAFLERRKPGGRFAVQPLYRALAGEFARRAACEWQPSSFVELCQKKGLCRSDLERFLSHAMQRPDPELQLNSIVATLTAENFSYRDLTTIQEGWRSYDIGLTDLSDVFIQEFREHMRAITQEVAAMSNWNTLREYLRAALAVYSTRHGALTPPFTMPFLQGALLRELKNYETRQPASIDSQPQEKTP